MAKDRKVILDSPVFIAYLNVEDSQHEKAIDIFKNIALDDIVISEYVLLEVLTVIQSCVSKKHAVKFENFVIDNFHNFILKSEHFFDNTLDMFSESPSKLSFVDVSLLALSKKYKIITFDKRLERAIKLYAKKNK